MLRGLFLAPVDSIYANDGHKKTPIIGVFSIPEKLLRNDVRSLLALGASSFVVGHALIFAQGLETFALDRGEMCEEVFAAAVRSNETKTLSVVEPLNGTCCHAIFLNKFKLDDMSVLYEIKGNIGQLAMPQFYNLNPTDGGIIHTIYICANIFYKKMHDIRRRGRTQPYFS